MSQPNDGGFPDKGKAVFYRAIELIDTPKKFWPVVRRLYRWSIDAGFDDCLAHYNYGRILQHYEQYEEAEEQYLRAIELDPEYARARNNLGCVLCLLGRYDEAEKAYRQALAIRDYFNPHNNLGDLYLRQGKLEEAKEELLLALEFAPNDEAALSTLAQVLAKEGKKDEAEMRFKQAREAAPEDLENLEAYAGFLEEEGRKDEAATLRREVARIKEEQSKQNPVLDEWQQRSEQFHKTRRK
jgi:Tfp pilus assembly protein PilF